MPKCNMISTLENSDEEVVNSKSLSIIKEGSCIDDNASERLKSMKEYLDKRHIKDINPEDVSGCCSLSFVIRRTLEPIDFLMKLCGLTYGNSCPLRTEFLIKHKIQRIYTILVATLVFCSALRFIPSLFRKTKSVQLIKYEYFLWNFKCAVQAFYCIFICSRYGRKISRFQNLISEYDEQLSRFKDSLDKSGKGTYQKVARLITIVLFGAILLTLALVGCTIFMSDGAQQEVLFEPFENPGLPLKLCLYISSFYLVVAWILPVVLYCYLCLSFCLVLDQFKTYIASRQSSKFDDYVDFVREEYRRVQELLAHTDDVIGFMALCVYCFDVILCCFHLFHFFYDAKSTMAKISPAYQATISLANLIFMSFCASRISEKGKMLGSCIVPLRIESITLEAHAKLMILLHEMNSEPLVLTVWKLIPLYKSIVISVFVSLITYFTLLVQFN